MHPTRPPQAPLPESGIRPLFLHKQAPAPSQESDFPERQAGFPPPYNTHKPADSRLQHDPAFKLSLFFQRHCTAFEPVGSLFVFQPVNSLLRFLFYIHPLICPVINTAHRRNVSRMIVMQTGKPLSLFFIDRSHSGAVIKPMLCIPVQYLTGRCGIIQKRIFFFQRD